MAGTRTVADLKEARQAVMDGADAVSFGEAQDLDGKAKLRFWDGRCGDCLLTVLKGPCPHPELGAWTNPVSDFGGNASQVIGHQALKGYRLGPPEGYSQIRYMSGIVTRTSLGMAGVTRSPVTMMVLRRSP